MGFIEPTTTLERLGKAARKSLGDKTSAECLDTVNSARKNVKITTVLILFCCAPIVVAGILGLLEHSVHPSALFFASLVFMVSCLSLDNQGIRSNTSEAFMQRAERTLVCMGFYFVCLFVHLLLALVHLSVKLVGEGMAHNYFTNCLVGCMVGFTIGCLVHLAHGTVDLVHSSGF